MHQFSMDELKKAIKIQQDGTHFDLFVIPNANTTLFPAGFNTWRKKIEIKVSSEAKDNKANKEILTTVAKFFNKPVKDVFIVSGKKGKEKTILIKDISLNTAVKQLQESINGL